MIMKTSQWLAALALTALSGAASADPNFYNMQCQVHKGELDSRGASSTSITSAKFTLWHSLCGFNSRDDGTTELANKIIVSVA
jgi:hypothetical protein